jgi:hypothetical protein
LFKHDIAPVPLVRPTFSGYITGSRLDVPLRRWRRRVLNPRKHFLERAAFVTFTVPKN